MNSTRCHTLQDLVCPVVYPLIVSVYVYTLLTLHIGGMLRIPRSRLNVVFLQELKRAVQSADLGARNGLNPAHCPVLSPFQRS